MFVYRLSPPFPFPFLGSRCVFKTPNLTNSVWKIHLKFIKSVFRGSWYKKSSSDSKYSHLCLISPIFVFLRFVFPACWFNHKKHTELCAVNLMRCGARAFNSHTKRGIKIIVLQFKKIAVVLRTLAILATFAKFFSFISWEGCNPIQVPLHPGVSRDPHCILKLRLVIHLCKFVTI